MIVAETFLARVWGVTFCRHKDYRPEGLWHCPDCGWTTALFRCGSCGHRRLLRDGCPKHGGLTAED